MKKVIFAILVIFSIALAMMVGKHMSTEAIAVVVGIACGVAASIPTSLLIMVLATRREDSRARQHYPPTVAINPGISQHSDLQLPGQRPPSHESELCQFDIVDTATSEPRSVVNRRLFLGSR